MTVQLVFHVMWHWIPQVSTSHRPILKTKYWLAVFDATGFLPALQVLWKSKWLTGKGGRHAIHATDIQMKFCKTSKTLLLQHLLARIWKSLLGEVGKHPNTTECFCRASWQGQIALNSINTKWWFSCLGTDILDSNVQQCSNQTCRWSNRTRVIFLMFEKDGQLVAYKVVPSSLRLVCAG